MTSRLLNLEKIAREINEKENEILKSAGHCCFLCNEHYTLLNRAELQTKGLIRGLVHFLEKLRHERREKRRRHKQNVQIRKNLNDEF